MVGEVDTAEIKDLFEGIGVKLSKQQACIAMYRSGPRHELRMPAAPRECQKADTPVFVCGCLWHSPYLLISLSRFIKVDRMVGVADTDGDGKVSKAEFAVAFHSTQAGTHPTPIRHP